MYELDAFTLLFANALIAASAAALAFGFGRSHDSIRGVSVAWGWFMALLSAASLTWFISQDMRSALSLVGNCLFAFLPLALVKAVSRLTGRQLWLGWFWILALAGCAGASITYLTEAPRYFASIPIGLGFALSTLWSLVVMLSWKTRHVSVYRYAFVVSLVVLVCASVVRVWAAFGGFHELLVPVSSSALQTSIVLAAMLLVTAGSMSVFGMLEELRLQRLAEEGQRDGLTGVLLRKPFFSNSSLVIERLHAPFSVLMLDIDHFKNVNDNFGHATGDAVITDCANVLKDMVRNGDLVGRLGGEEFALMLPRCGAAEAHEVAERIRQQVAGRAIIGRAGAVHYTVSIGVSEGRSGATPQALLDLALQEADEALYEAKRNGRNQVVVKRPDPEMPTEMLVTTQWE